jgi:hypothetical protein
MNGFIFDLADETEYPLVFDAWANSFRKSPWAGVVPNHLWPQTSRAMINDILARGARVLVAAVPLETGRRVAGYSVSEPDKNVLHWLFVKQDFRLPGLQLGTQLLNETCPGNEPWTYTCRTKASTRFLGPRFGWDPVPARIK